MAGELLTRDLRRNSVTFKLFSMSAFTNKTAPTVAQLNTVNERLGLDVTCALDEETTTFTLGSSDIDERLSFCDGVGTSLPNGANPELSLGIYRDKDRAANGIFRKAFDWLRHPDQEYILVERVGDQDSGPRNGVAAAAFTVADHIRMIQFSTDYPADTLANEDPALLVIQGLPSGFVAWNINPSA